MSEEIKGALEVARTTAWGTEKDYLYFTSNRVIMAKVAGDTLTSAFGIPGTIIEGYREKKRKEKLKQLTAESILKADSRNFAIPYSDIIKVEMKKPGRIWKAKIDITTHEKTHKFALLQKKEQFDESVNLVRSVLPDKLFLIR